MINISEIQSNIKNIEMICPKCFKYDLVYIKKYMYKNNKGFYIKQLKKIFNENSKCFNNLNCLNLDLKWCIYCFNWFCEKCSKTHICNINKNEPYGIHDHPKHFLSKNDINTNNQCSLHNKPCLFYCDYHENLCEDCEDCDLVFDKKKREISHGACHFGPVLYYIIKSKIKNIEEKIEKFINIFNSYIFNLYNNNKDKYKNTKRKRFERNFKKFRNNFVSFLEFIFLLIRTYQKVTYFSSILNDFPFEIKKFEYDKNIKNKSLKNFNSQLSNYFATQYFINILNLEYYFEKDKTIDLSKYNLNLISNNFKYNLKKEFLFDWELEISEEELNSNNLLEFNENFFIEFDKNDLKYKNLLKDNYYDDKFLTNLKFKKIFFLKSIIKFSAY